MNQGGGQKGKKANQNLLKVVATRRNAQRASKDSITKTVS